MEGQGNGDIKIAKFNVLISVGFCDHDLTLTTVSRPAYNMNLDCATVRTYQLDMVGFYRVKTEFLHSSYRSFTALSESNYPEKTFVVREGFTRWVS